MEIHLFIYQKIKEKNKSKAFVYRNLGMTQVGFTNSIERGNITLKKYIEIAKMLDFDPCEIFGKQSQGEYVNFSKQEKNRPLDKYSKNDAEMISDLMQQNLKLIAIIENLTNTAQ